MVRPRTAPSYRIDPFDLRLFAAVAEAGSITAGAARVQLSLAAASTRLQGLEHAMGVALLSRSKRGVSPTDAGRTLLLHAGHMQRQIEALHADMAAHALGVRSTVRVLCNTAAMADYLPPLLGDFLAKHPDIDVDLRELDSQEVLAAMRRGQADLGVVADHVDTQGLLTRTLREDRLVAMLPAHDAVGRTRGKSAVALAFASLLERPFIGLPADSGLSRFLTRHAMLLGRGMHHRVRVGSFDAVAALVTQGVGVAVVPEHTAQRLANPQLVTRPLADPWATRRLVLCLPASTTHVNAAAQMLAAHVAPPPREPVTGRAEPRISVRRPPA